MQHGAKERKVLENCRLAIVEKDVMGKYIWTYGSVVY